MNAAKLHHSWWSGSHDCSCSPSLSLSQPTPSHPGYYSSPLSFAPSVFRDPTGSAISKPFVTDFSFFSIIFLLLHFLFFFSCFFVSLLVSCFVFPVCYSSATLCFPNFHFILNILAFVASFWFLICFFVFLFTSFFLLCCLSYLFCICLFLGFFHSCHPHLPFLNSPLPFQLTRCFPSASISCLPSNLFICHVLLLSEFLCLLHFVFSFFLFIFPFLFIFLSAYLSVLLTFDSFFLMFLPFSLHSPIWTSAWLTFTLITSSSSLSFFLFSSLSLILSPIRFHLLHLIWFLLFYTLLLPFLPSLFQHTFSPSSQSFSSSSHSSCFWSSVCYVVLSCGYGLAVWQGRGW